jgi:hypothetical protein
MPTLKQHLVFRVVELNAERERSMKLARLLATIFPYHRRRSLIYVGRAAEADRTARAICKWLKPYPPLGQGKETRQ